jgi:tRNA threonylcarbamoyladenosine biosynthesis protein TsaB
MAAHDPAGRMKILAIETATEACSLALAVDGKVFSRHVVAGRDQTAVLLPLLSELIAEAAVTIAQLDGIACGVGPGSFAGVRVGVGFVKGLAMVRDLPVVPVSSLASLAQGAMRRHRAQRVASCIDARMGEVYIGTFEQGHDGLARSIDEPRVCKPDAVQIPLTSSWTAAGTGWGTYGNLLRERCAFPPDLVEADALPDAIDVLALAAPSFESGATIAVDVLEPVYLRNAVALTLEQQARARQDRIASKKETT